jgi:hypothetical protein
VPERGGQLVRSARRGRRSRRSAGHQGCADGPKGLQRCSWRFWDEPDDANRGPQIVVTEPSGEEHYLVDLETFWSKLRQRSGRRAAGPARDDPERAMLLVMGGSGVEDTPGRGVQGPAPGAVSSTTATTRGRRWSTRLRQAFSRRGGGGGGGCGGQPRTILPLCYKGGGGGGGGGPGQQPEDSETGRLLGFVDGAWDGCRRRQGLEVDDLLRLIGVLGLLRTIAYCCSKS